MIPKPRLEELVKISNQELNRKQSLWESEQLSDETIPHFKYGIAGRYKTLAGTYALLDSRDEATGAYNRAAKNYLGNVQAKRQQSTVDRENEPAVLVQALNCAQLACNRSLLEKIAEETLETDESHIGNSVSTDTPFRYYNAMIRAAIILNDDRQQPLLKQYQDAVEQLNKPYPNTMGAVYAGIVQADLDQTALGLKTLLEYHDESVTAQTDHPGEYIAETPIALCLLARERGLEVTLESESIPDCLLDPKDHSELETDRTQLNESTNSDHYPSLDRPEITCDPDTGEYVLVASIDHPGDREATVDDLPMTEAGRLLSDEWVDAVLEMLRTSDDGEQRQLAETLETARERGELERKLVIQQEQRVGHLFDETLADLGIDRIDIIADNRK